MTILVGTDFSPSSHPVTQVAAALAARLRERLVVAHVISGPRLPQHQQRMDALLAELRGFDVRAEGILEQQLPVGERLAALAGEVGATLVVVGAQGEGLRPLLGTVATGVLHHVGAPLLVVRRAERLQRLTQGKGVHALVCTALDETDPALRHALALVATVAPVDAELAHYEPLPVHAGDRHDAARLAKRDVYDAFNDINAVTCRPVVRDGFGRLDAHLADLATERDVDLVITGSHRRHGLERLREGSVAEGVVKHAAVSVLVAAAPAKT